MTKLRLSRIAGAARAGDRRSAPCPPPSPLTPAATHIDHDQHADGQSSGSRRRRPPRRSTQAAPTSRRALEQAIADLKLVSNTTPRAADGWNLLGFSYRNHGDLKLPTPAYDKALQLNPNHTGALSYQGYSMSDGKGRTRPRRTSQDR